jgi:hypothetical protein
MAMWYQLFRRAHLPAVVREAYLANEDERHVLSVLRSPRTVGETGFRRYASQGTCVQVILR